MQKTISNIVECMGIGLHGGDEVKIIFKPAPENSGIIFRRIDDQKNLVVEIKANFENVFSTTLCTSLSSVCGKYQIATVEHLMAALWGCGIDNIIIEINADEIPIMDGSSIEFVSLFENAGIIQQYVAKKYLEILKSIRVEEGDAYAELTPGKGFSINMEIDFAHKLISKQALHFTGSSNDFKLDLSSARTFGFIKDVEQLKKMGLAKGGSLENAVVLDEENILNKDGLRYSDEFVRHKVLDSIGDLYLAGYNIVGEFLGKKSGHKLNNLLLRKLFKDKSAWRVIEEASLNPI